MGRQKYNMSKKKHIEDNDDNKQTTKKESTVLHRSPERDKDSFPWYFDVVHANPICMIIIVVVLIVIAILVN